jgi:hypothetical protein
MCARVSIAVAAFLALAVAFPVMAAQDTACATGTPAESIVCRLYERYLELRPAGLPTRKQQAKLAPFLSRRLLSLLDRARLEQQDHARRFPDEKPPFVDGSLFASLFEGPDRFEVLSADPRADGIHVAVRFGYRDAAPWEDVIVVVRQGRDYAIDDILFGGAGEFNPAGRLTDRLPPS